MKSLTRIALLVLLTVLVFVPTRPAAARDTLPDGEVIFGQSYTLASGEVLVGDLIIFGGSATLEAGARLEGSVVLFGGSLTIDGEVTGDVAITGGSTVLGPQAYLHGDLVMLAATLVRDEGARVDGQITTTTTSWVTSASNGEGPQPPVVLPPFQLPDIGWSFAWLQGIGNAIAQAIGLAVLAALLMFFLAPNAGRVAQAVYAQPLVAGGLGLLTVVVAPVALVALGLLTALIITAVVTVPLIVILSVALGMAFLFGWIAVGYDLGQRFMRRIHQEWHPAISAGLGTFALSIVSLALTGIPALNCIGWLIPTVLGLAALGAVVMTRFGTQAVLVPVAADAPQAPAAPLPPAVVDLPPVLPEPTPRRKSGRKPG